MKAALAVAISAAAVVTGSAQQPTFSSRVDAVRVDVLVKDRGQIVRGLEATGFRGAGTKASCRKWTSFASSRSRSM